MDSISWTYIMKVKKHRSATLVGVFVIVNKTYKPKKNVDTLITKLWKNACIWQFLIFLEKWLILLPLFYHYTTHSPISKIFVFNLKLSYIFQHNVLKICFYNFEMTWYPDYPVKYLIWEKNPYAVGISDN